MDSTTLTFDQLTDCWLAIESEYQLFDIEVDGVPVWERARRAVFGQLVRKSGQFPDTYTESSISAGEYLVGVGHWLENCVRNNPFFAGSHDVLVLGHERRKQLDDGCWWDIYCDPIYEYVDRDFQHVEKPYRNSHRTPAKTTDLRYLDLIEYTGTLQRKLGLAAVTVPTAVERTVRAAENALEDRVGVAPTALERIRYELAVRRSTKWLYERLVSRIDPDLAIVLVSYDRETFVEVCQERDIPVVELQHGIVHPYHPGYHFPGDRSKEVFPDYFFSFGEFWNDQVAFPIPDDRVIGVGYPFLEQRRAKYADCSERDQFVFVSQQSIGEPLSKLAVAVARQLPHDVVYKIHPKSYDSWESRYPWLTDAPVDVVAGDQPSLYQLFAESTVQVGVGSTALYEGLQFDLATYVVDLPSMEYTRPLVEAGYATVVKDDTELVAAVDGASHEPLDATALFADDALATIERELDRLLSL